MGLYESDPVGASAFIGATDWLKAVLLGSVGTTTAVLAIASVGFLLLAGRIPVRRGVTIILGCFILFSASAIADGLVGVVSAGRSSAPDVPPPPNYEPTNPMPQPYDPYAGASLPTQQERPLIR